MHQVTHRDDAPSTEELHAGEDVPFTESYLFLFHQFGDHQCFGWYVGFVVFLWWSGFVGVVVLLVEWCFLHLGCTRSSFIPRLSPSSALNFRDESEKKAVGGWKRMLQVGERKQLHQLKA